MTKFSIIKIAMLAFAAGMIMAAGFFYRDRIGEIFDARDVEIANIKKASNLDEQVRWYKKLIERVGPEEAQEQLLRSGLPFDGETHLLNHTVGDYLYKKYGTSGLSKCKDYFLASCYHGFVLNAIAEGGEEQISKIMAECEKMGNPVVAQCSHAVGHGYLAYLGYENLNQALLMCSDTADKISPFLAFNCEDGVFMENIWAVHDGTPSAERWIHPDDDNYPCNDPRVEEKYTRACWSNQPALLYQRYRGDIKKVGEVCEKIENKSNREMCFNGLSRQISPVSKNSVQNVFKLCGLLPNDWVNYCLTTNAISSFSVGDREIPYAICEATRNESNQKECYKGLTGVIRAYARDINEYEKYCEKIRDDSLKENCLLNKPAF